MWLESSIASILASEDLIPRVTIVDNSGDVGAHLDAGIRQSIRTIDTGSNVGYTGGVNVALRTWLRDGAGDGLCVVGSHDLHVAPDALRRLVDAAETSPAYGILGPSYQRPFESSGGRWARGGAAWAEPRTGFSGLVERDWVSGTCMLLRRRCVERVGPLDERFGSYVEDVDYCLRARDAGWKVGVVVEAEAWGLGTRTSRSAEMNDANLALLLAKREGTASASRWLATLGIGAVRSSLAAVAPWRPAARRAESRAFVARRTGALRRARRHLRAILRGQARVADAPLDGTIEPAATATMRALDATSRGPSQTPGTQVG
jgi:GT2 family glycosyltransferase